MSFYCEYNGTYISDIRSCGCDVVCDCRTRDLDPAHAGSDRPWRVATGSNYVIHEDSGRVIGTFKSPVVAKHIVELHNASLKGAR